ncbi:9686_t:CDS:2, partial [Ambispora gerdemannii]
MSFNISSLEALALNILKNSFSKKIAEGVDVPELDPCSLCNQELFLYEIKNPITILICGHIYHRDCIEKSIKKCSICPRPDCKKEIEEAKPRDYVSSTVDATPGSQNTSDLMDISPRLFTDLHFPSLSQYSSLPEKRVSEFTNKSSSKKVKKPVSKEDSPTLRRLIKELTTPTQKTSSSNTIILQSDVSEIDKDSVNFRELYDKITNAEDNNQKITHDLIYCHYDFGKGIKLWFDHYRKTCSEDASNARVNDKIREQISAQDKLTETNLRKRKERAKKILIILDDVDYIISKVLEISPIQTIIDHFTKKPEIDFTDDQDNSDSLDDLSETEIGEKTLPETE